MDAPKYKAQRPRKRGPMRGRMRGSPEKVISLRGDRTKVSRLPAAPFRPVLSHVPHELRRPERTVSPRGILRVTLWRCAPVKETDPQRHSRGSEELSRRCRLFVDQVLLRKLPEFSRRLPPVFGDAPRILSL